MQRRHRGVEIGRNGCCFVGDVGHDGRVDEASPWDQPRWSDRQHTEHEERDRVHSDQRVARRTVGGLVAPIDPEEHEQSRRQEHQLVVPAHQQLQAVVLAQEVVQHRLDIDVQPRLDRQDPPPVVNREIRAGMRGLPDAVVGEDKR